ncbi:methyltransferase FkbM family [Stackebrandtia nassauensis DSM 44728]|uniref:Methyltransferase FkbM family n=2 Tax=Stackebrandtia TaxID=283810 RepID=D3Q445_STANL|nr:methyltransferase FkbM family [Stackebrandtia nassauensis DSM 44728]
MFNALSTIGFKVYDLGPGTGLVTRRKDYQVVDVSSRSWLVTRGKQDPVVAKAVALANGDKVASGQKSVLLGPNAKLVLDDNAVVGDEHGFQKPAHNYLCNRHVAELLRHYRVNCVFDVGANVGQYAKNLRKFGYTGRIVSFEPVPHIAEKLRAAAEGDPDWQVHQCALGREAGSVTMNVVKGSMSSILGPTDFGSTRYKRFNNIDKVDVPVHRLDAIMDEAMAGLDDPRPYLKLDTQGLDLEAFAGTGDRVKQLVGMQSEVALMHIYEGMPGMMEALGVYTEAGFEITGMYPVSREQTTKRVLEFDCVMARAESAPAV